MRHPQTLGFTPDQQATYDEWLWLLTRWGTHNVDEAHELALHRAAEEHELIEGPLMPTSHTHTRPTARFDSV